LLRDEKGAASGDRGKGARTFVSVTASPLGFARAFNRKLRLVLGLKKNKTARTMWAVLTQERERPIAAPVAA
jgi:hypothetical protein